MEYTEERIESSAKGINVGVGQLLYPHIKTLSEDDTSLLWA